MGQLSLNQDGLKVNSIFFIVFIACFYP